MKILNVLIFLLIFNTFILLGYISSTMTGNVVSERITGNVTHIVDGDTLDVDIGKTILRIRMLGINNKSV